MPADIPFLLLGAVLVAVGVLAASRHRAPAPHPGVPAVGPLPALARIGRLGDPGLADPQRALAHVAPTGSPQAAVQLVGTDGTLLAEVALPDVVMARGWSGGSLLLTFGENRRDYGPSWPLGRNVAGWEIHLVDRAGTLLRCSGVPGAGAARELDRLHDRIVGTALARAG